MYHKMRSSILILDKFLMIFSVLVFLGIKCCYLAYHCFKFGISNIVFIVFLEQY